MIPQEDLLPIDVLQQVATLAGMSLSEDHLKAIARGLLLYQEDLRRLRAVQLGDTEPMTIFKR